MLTSPAFQASGSLSWDQESPYRVIFESISDGMVINDARGKIVEVNSAMCAMHGYTREEMLQLDPRTFILPEHHPLFDRYVETTLAGMPFHARAIDVRKDGRQFHVDVRGHRLVLNGTSYTLAVVRDITERIQAYELLEQRVDERTKELATLLDVSRAVTSTLELRPLLSLILDKLKIVADYTGATITELDGDELRLLDSRGPTGRELEAVDMRIPLSRFRPIWKILSRREPVIIGDIRDKSPLARAYRSGVGARLETDAFRYIRSWLGVPLIMKDCVQGLVSLSSSEPNFYTARDASLVMAIASHVAVAIENARLFEAEQGKAAIEERQRLARDLHDSVSQTLFSAGLIAEVLPRLWERDSSEGKRRLEELRQLTRGALAEMRMLLLELRPTVLTEMPLGDLLRHLAEATTGRARLPASLTVSGTPRPLPPDVQVALYRVTQEAINNAVKHTSAHSVLMTLSYAPDGVEVAIRDDGRGFVPSEVRGAHHGLRIMRERSDAIGATLNVESTPGAGTLVHVRWCQET